MKQLALFNLDAVLRSCAGGDGIDVDHRRPSVRGLALRTLPTPLLGFQPGDEAFSPPSTSPDGHLDNSRFLFLLSNGGGGDGHGTSYSDLRGRGGRRGSLAATGSRPHRVVSPSPSQAFTGSSLGRLALSLVCIGGGAPPELRWLLPRGFSSLSFFFSRGILLFSLGLLLRTRGTPLDSVHQGRPVETVRIEINPIPLAPHLLHVGLKDHHVFGDDHAPVLPQPQHVDHLQCGSDVVGVHAGVVADGANAQPGHVVLVEVLHDGALPVAVVADATQIGERFLWGARLALHAGEEVAEIDQEAAEALSLVLRHRHDARDVVLLLAGLLLGEIADEVAALAIVLGQHVEEEGLHVVVEGLVIQKQLGEETEVLAVDLAGHAVHFEDGEVFVAVDFVGRRVKPVALGPVALQDPPALHVLEAELAEEELWEHGILLRVRGRVPRLDLVLAELDHGRGAGAGVHLGAVDGVGHVGQCPLLRLFEEVDVAFGDPRGKLGRRGLLHLETVQVVKVQVCGILLLSLPSGGVCIVVAVITDGLSQPLLRQERYHAGLVGPPFPIGRRDAYGANPPALGEGGDGRVQTLHVEPLVAGVADEQVVGVGGLAAEHAPLALQTEPRLGPDPFHEGVGVLQTGRVPAVAAVVARDELLAVLLPVLLRRAETETADGAGLHLGLGKGVHPEDGHLDQPAVFLQATLLQVLCNGALYLVAEVRRSDKTVLPADVLFDVSQSGPFQVQHQDGFLDHPHDVGRVQNPPGHGEGFGVSVRGHPFVDELNDAAGLHGFLQLVQCGLGGDPELQQHSVADPLFARPLFLPLDSPNGGE